MAIELTWEGTQSGPIATPDGRELPPSNKRITVKSVQVIEIEDGKLKALRHDFDLMTLLQQIGALDQAEAARATPAPMTPGMAGKERIRCRGASPVDNPRTSACSTGPMVCRPGRKRSHGERSLSDVAIA